MRFLVISLAMLGCATSSEVRPLTVYPVEWNAQKVPLGKVAAVAESGEDVVVFGSLGALTFTNGALVATDGSIREWRSATTMPAADGAGTWMVGLDVRGRLYRVRNRSTLEAISGRFGLEKSDVRAVTDLGRGRVAFLLASEVAIGDGDRVTRFGYPFAAIAGGDGRGVGVTADLARVFDPFRGVDRTFAVEGLRFAALTSAGRVVVASERAIWREDESEKLTLRYRSDNDSLRGIAASAENVWFADGGELGMITSSAITRTTGMTSATARLLPSPSGDVWVLREDGSLARFSTTRAAGLWQTTIAAIQARVCSACHGPGGSGGVDLSTAARWEAKRTAIERRVVKDRSMPPAGHPIGDEERAAVARWVAGS